MSAGDADALVARVRAFRGRRVAVVADLVADEFVHGDIARVSREAPVLVLDHRETVRVPGGGGNSVANLRALGARPLPVGVVGDDAAGRALLDAFRAAGVSTAGVVKLAGYATPTKSRVLAGGVHTRRQQIVRIDRGAPRGELPRAVRARLRAALARELDRAEGVLVADYNYGAASPEWCLPLLARVRARGGVATVDSRGRIAAFRGMSACTPNLEELEQAAGGPPLGDDAELDRAARTVLRRTGNEALLVTLGARGMALYRGRAKPVRVAAYGDDEVADVTGAGDTVIAAFTLALLAGADALQAMRLANCAAGLVVQKAGTATVGPEELSAALAEGVP